MSWQDYHIISIAAVENIKGSWLKIKQSSTLSCLKSNTIPLPLFPFSPAITMQFDKVGLGIQNKHSHVRPARANGSNRFTFQPKPSVTVANEIFLFCSWLAETDLGPLHLLPASVPTPKIACWRKKCQLLSSTGCFLNPLLEDTYFRWNLACHHAVGKVPFQQMGRGRQCQQSSLDINLE